MKLLVSACLLGVACRYDGKAKAHEGVISLREKHTLIPFCPEVYGGLPTPRPASERRGERVFIQKGDEVTEQFCRGAEETLRLCRLYGCEAALLKERSPSCGHGVIHNGQFDGGLVPGNGVTAEWLLQNGIAVYGESDWEALL